MSDKQSRGFFGDDELFDDPASVVEQISDLLHQGKMTQAKSLLTRRWKDLVPGLPLRFSIVLEQPGERVVLGIAKAMKRGQESPTLVLQARSERHGGYAVMTEEGRKLGDLPSRDAQFLRSMGEAAALYAPQLLEIRTVELGKLELIAVEMVRPETRICSSCNAHHTNGHVNCDDCRAKRRRVEEKPHEGATVPFHDALDALQTAKMRQDVDPAAEPDSN